MLPMPEENDSTTIVVVKLVMIVLTLTIAGLSTLSEGIRILRWRFRKNPSMGFTKDI
jgi:hypothetical protein